jgi:metal-sulfur cluster biosynthetic enzyme
MRRRAVEAESMETQIQRALAEILDPETGLSIMRMDLVHGLEVGPDGSVSLIFRPSSPVCPMAYSLANSIKNKLETIGAVGSIKIRVENFERAAHLEALLQSPTIPPTRAGLCRHRS